MSEQQVEGAPGGTGGEPSPDQVALPPQGDAAFGALMDALAPEPDAGSQARGEDGRYVAEPGAEPAAGEGAAAGAGGAAGAAAAGAPGTAAAPAGGTAPAQPGAGEPAAGGAQQPADAGRAAGVPDAWTADASDLIPKFGQLSTALEENTSKAYQAAALEEVRTAHPKYFEALDQHPRLLVGQTVPSITGEGTETLRDANDARDWQDAVKHTLVAEVRDRAGRAVEENRGFLDTVHQSIELFQNNPDLIPGTKGFDIDLANRFTSLAEPYELRVEGKLQGYSIPVQHLISKIREDLIAERAKAPAPQTPASPAAPVTPSSAAAGEVGDQPQGGIASKAGSGSSAEDFSTLFGTIGLPNLTI